jgi:cobalamin biosynthesis protein CobT
MSILAWLLATVRSWDVPELEEQRDQLQGEAEKGFSGLTLALKPVLSSVPARCHSTFDTLAVAREITGILQKYMDSQQEQEKAQEVKDRKSNNTGEEGETKDSDESKKSKKTVVSESSENSEEVEDAGEEEDTEVEETAEEEESGNIEKKGEITEALRNLTSLLSADEKDLPGDFGSLLQNVVTKACNENKGKRLQVAVVSGKMTCPLSQWELDASCKATTALRTRLQALVQSTRSSRNHSGYTGVLNTRKLHTLVTGNTKVFLRRGEKIGVNTAVHLLLDSSSSMCGNQMRLASQTCFAVASALHGIRGLSLGVTAFPGRPVKDDHSPTMQNDDTVTPILRHNQKMHADFNVQASGGTPMAPALWWVLQQLYFLPEVRKLVVLITDGMPDDLAAARTAVKAVRDQGIEVYGIGMMTDSIFRLLPAEYGRKIMDIRELAPAVFGILQGALVGKHQVS